MRISDWSSDVCSSDLRRGHYMQALNAILEGAFTQIQMGPMMFPYEYTGYRDEITASKSGAWIGCTLCCAPVYDVKGPDAVKFQIGRASCRDRVCQYV